MGAMLTASKLPMNLRWWSDEPQNITYKQFTQIDDSHKYFPGAPQLKRIARAMYSNPPTYGARIAAEVVNDPELFAEWKVGELLQWSGWAILNQLT